MSGLYLAIATLAFGSIVGTVFQKWTAVTGGFDGFPVPTPYVFGIPIEGANGIYYASLVVLVFVLWLSANLLRTPVGRAMVAIRDSEISAQSMGIVTAIAPKDGLDALVEATVQRILASSPAAIRAVKEYIRSAPDMPIEGAVEFARNLHAAVNSSEDVRTWPAHRSGQDRPKGR